MRLLLAIVLSAVVVTSSSLAAFDDGGPRLRPQDARLSQLLRQGAERSTTFKALVDRIEAGDVIVYLAINPLMKQAYSGMLTWMTKAGGFRYVRASISPDLTPDQMIATLAHELQHAVEVVEDSAVTDEKTLVALYKRIGSPNRSSSSTGWETVAAQEAGYQVRRELVSVPASATARAVISSQS
jgi:hypothetical protein